MPANFGFKFDYFDALFHNTKENTVLLMEADGCITAVNTAFTECFGHTKEDAIGKNFSFLFREEDFEKGMPQNEIKTVLRKGQCSDNNYLVKKDKTLIWVSGESLLVKNEEGGINILKVIQNIQKQKVSEYALKRSTDFNESILTSIEEVVIVLNNKLEIIQYNKAFNKMLGIPNGEASLLNFHQMILPYDVNGVLLNNIESVLKNKDSFLNHALTIEFTPGNERVLDVSCIPLQTPEGNNVVLVMHDITIYKQMEREREDIIGFVAHELRNPLANVMLCNEIMTKAINDNNPEEIKSFLERSKNNVMRLNKMIAELYDATKMHSGNLKLDSAEFNFQDMLKEAIETIQILQPFYTINLYGNADLRFYGDRHKLIQVVTNYLSNGIKYSNGKTSVTLSVEYNDDTITISVKDEGLGISKEQLPFIFQKFFRAEKTRNLEGVGLGLYICEQIIHAHKGKVWAESEEGKGSVFYFSLPLP